VMTAFGNLDTAVRAISQGAFDYLSKPFDLDQAGRIVRRALDAAASPHAAASETAADAHDSFVGASPAMQRIFKQIALVAAADVPVLITGESGTGKELAARAIHRHSARREGPFLPICLPALNPGLIESELFGHMRGSFTGAAHDRRGLLELAQGGTVLLDEIADASLGLQVKLLRAIEQREVTPVGDARPRSTDIRIVAATNRPLGELVAGGEFREDLYFRLSVFHIHLPPLRERREDIPLLADFFLRQTRPLRRGLELSEEVRNELVHRDWPGNVRELRNAIEHAAILAREGCIRLEHLPAQGVMAGAGGERSRLQTELSTWARDALRPEGDAEPPTDLYEKFLELLEPGLLQAVVEECGGNRAAAAQRLGLHRATLRQKLRKYGLSPDRDER
ncbi:MAG TPA: sigma-54 dependent transcriptional regulator, partial [Planctomycetaceae bacterium]|nr:sigma-54 dependent transcriptional regulator [Planctomycetaceae bacterium]